VRACSRPRSLSTLAVAEYLDNGRNLTRTRERTTRSPMGRHLGRQTGSRSHVVPVEVLLGLTKALVGRPGTDPRFSTPEGADQELRPAAA